MKKIKKECLKHMVAGPCLVGGGGKQIHKDSILSAGKKNSTCGPAYNSDNEDNKQSENSRVRDEVNREAKNWH